MCKELIFLASLQTLQKAHTYSLIILKEISVFWRFWVVESTIGPGCLASGGKIEPFWLAPFHHKYWTRLEVSIEAVPDFYKSRQIGKDTEESWLSNDFMFGPTKG